MGRRERLLWDEERTGAEQRAAGEGGREDGGAEPAGE